MRWEQSTKVTMLTFISNELLCCLITVQNSKESCHNKNNVDFFKHTDEDGLIAMLLKLKPYLGIHSQRVWVKNDHVSQDCLYSCLCGIRNKTGFNTWETRKIDYIYIMTNKICHNFMIYLEEVEDWLLYDKLYQS